MTHEEAQRLNKIYEARRAAYRREHGLPPGRNDDRPPPAEFDDEDSENG